MAPRRLILACLAIVVLGFVAQVLAECRHGCSNHGDCHHGSCRCNTGWAGDDCSEADTPLNSGEVVRGSLNSFTWHYYHVQVPYGTSALNITAHQTSRYGDVDVYVQRDRFPTERDYAARDVGTDPDIYLQLPNPAPGRWYIGMYGYWHVDYTLQVDIIAGCPLDCGENGQCSGRECVCNSPYAGETCNIYDRPLNSGVPFTESVASGEWKFFRISTAPNNYLDIVVVEDGAGDVDVYVKRDTYPSFFDFDYLNGTIHPTSTVHLDDAEVGVWRIGIYGYRGDRFTITATVGASLGCSGQCSGASHGACNGRRCQCLAEYTGELCERKRVSLALDTPVTGFVDTNFWNYYTFRIVTQNNVIIRTVQTSSSGSDCDVFVKAGSDPTRIDYEYANLSNLADFNVTIPEPGDTEWHIGVYGWTSCAYTLSITIPVTCSCVGDNGYCEPGSDVCVCNAGWSGITCQDHASILNMGQVYTQQSVEQYQWKYYSISSNSSAMLVSLRETNTRGYLWLFMSQGSFPTLENYEEADKETNTNFHEVHAVFQRAEVRVFYIGVYGNPFGVRGNDGTPFSITAWAPPF